jgi:hypothetical protein
MANIFFIMPFRPGLNFMFLHMKHFIESNFEDTRCVRGDTNISPGLLINKIRSNIEEADVVIADCSGGNPNVFYELGVAHALGKQVLLIHDTEEAVIPTDIQGYERLLYGFNDDGAFCAKMRGALQAIIRDKYQVLYEKASDFIEAFNRECGKNVPVKDAARFRADLKSRESAVKLPPLNDERRLATYLIPSIADGVLDLEIAAQMKLWIDNTYPATRVS